MNADGKKMGRRWRQAGSLSYVSRLVLAWRDLGLFRPALDARDGIMGRTGRSALPHFWIRAVMPVFIVLVLA